ncbi:hypothetical protein B0H14DRAFT_3165054 [Mycena olivaceomarginata]|nr:hypothetical protein B0H14DRAFT_3165054 [Mycena olivaceomarginata]
MCPHPPELAGVALAQAKDDADRSSCSRIHCGFRSQAVWRRMEFVERVQNLKTHGFFVSMGGFVDSSGCPVTTREQLNDPVVGPECLAAIRSIDAEDIMDKSKGDALSKGLALAQGLWFCVQYFGRIHQHLAVTQLEVATLAFAIVSVFIWVLWWGKPLDVQRPIVIGSPKAEAANVTRRDLPVRIKFFGVIGGLYEDTPDEKYDPLSSSSVPSFWTSQLGENKTEFIFGFVFEWLVGIVFGAIHCAAWNAGFPTAGEMWIGGAAHYQLLFDEDTVFLFPLIYVLARIPLLLLPFIALRSLPPAAFADVNWSTSKFKRSPQKWAEFITEHYFIQVLKVEYATPKGINMVGVASAAEKWGY